MLDAADVQVDAALAVGGRVWGGHPVSFDVGVDEGPVVGRVEVAQEVPAGSGPLRHGVEFTPVSFDAVAQVEFDGAPVRGSGEWWYRVAGLVFLRFGAEVGHLGQSDRQGVVGKRDRQSVLVVDDRERLAPVTLPGEQPVTQPVGPSWMAGVLGLQPVDGGGDCVLLAQPGQFRSGGLGVRAVAGECGFPHSRRGGPVNTGTGEPGCRGLQYCADVQAELVGEVQVPLIVSGDGHDRAGAVPGEHVVGQEDGDLFPSDRVDDVGAGEHAGLVVTFASALPVAQPPGHLLVGGDRSTR